MKNHTIKICGLIAVMFITLTACEEDVIDMNRGEGAVPSITNLDPAVFFPTDLENTQVSFDLDIANYTGDLVILVSQDGDKSRAPVKTVSSYPTNVTITFVEVAQALGKSVNDLPPGSTFNFEVQTTIGNDLYRSNAAFNAPLACEYDPANFTGAYTGTSSGWGVNGPITIFVDEEDPFTLYVSGLVGLDGMVEDQGPLRMTVNPANFHVTAHKTVLGTNFFGYDNVAYEGTGILDTCTGEYNMNFAITVDQGSFGSYGFTLSRN